MGQSHAYASAQSRRFAGNSSGVARSFAHIAELVATQVRYGYATWGGFACVLSWIFLSSWSTASMQHYASSGFDAIAVRGLIAASEGLLALVVFLRLARQDESFKPRLVWIAAATTSVGTILLFLAGMLNLSPVVFCAACVACGFGYGLMFVLWGSIIGRRSPSDILVLVGLAILAATLIDAAGVLSGGGVTVAIMVVVPIVSAWAMLHRPKEVFEQREVLSTPTPARDSSRLATTRVPARIVLPLLIASASYGLMPRLAETGNATNDPVILLSFVAAATFLILSVPFFERHEAHRTILPIAFAVVAIAFVLIAFIPQHGEAVQFVYMFGYNFFYFLVWAMCGTVARHYSMSTARAYAGITCILAGADGLMAMLGGQVVSLIPEGGLSFVSLLAVYGFMMVALFAFPLYSASWLSRASSTAGEKGDSLKDAPDAPDTPATITAASAGEPSAEPTATPTDASAAALDQIVATYGLTRREAEVLALLARGRNSSHVAKQLVVSNETARVHIRNIYRKLSVHSQQELIDLVDGHATGDVS